MKKHIIAILSLFLLVSTLSAEEIITRKDGTKVVLYNDHTWAEVNSSESSINGIVNKNKSFLRVGIKASDSEITIACEMYEQGWTYTMPRPKSPKAAWGVTDGRTTWYNGWWYNTKTSLYSNTTPKKSSSGSYIGDSLNNSNSWRKDGTPRKPDVFMFLLSKSGGPSY